VHEVKIFVAQYTDETNTSGCYLVVRHFELHCHVSFAGDRLVRKAIPFLIYSEEVSEPDISFAAC